MKSGALAPDPAQAELLAALIDLAHAVQKDKGWKPKFFTKKKSSQHGLYIHGPVGRGKSKITSIFFENLAVEKKQRLHFHAFMKMVHEELNRIRKNKKITDPIAALVKNLKVKNLKIELLLLDEFYVTNIADAMILGRLFENLFAQNIAVVVTSNRAPDELYAGGLNRDRFLPFIKLIKQKMTVVELSGGQDYRLQKLKTHPVYLSPLTKKNKIELEQIFIELTHGVPGQPRTLEFDQRQLLVPRAAKTTAMFDFADLCDAPLAASDYLHLAKMFDTIFITNIPQLGEEDHNQALRFITLIDVLYENKTKLVCTAAVRPEKLYQTGTHAFEFERTVSRLIEMQSADYLSQ